jgi:hypothetical protein
MLVAALGVPLTTATAAHAATPQPSGLSLQFKATPIGVAHPDYPVIFYESCVANFTPVPQYSSSGGSYGTLHYGATVNCTGNVVKPLWLWLRVYHVEGNGDFEHNVEQIGLDYNLGPRTTQTLATPGPPSVACLGRTSTRWILSLQAKWNGIYLKNSAGQTTAWSPVETLPCQ